MIHHSNLFHETSVFCHFRRGLLSSTFYENLLKWPKLAIFSIFITQIGIKIAIWAIFSGFYEKLKKADTKILQIRTSTSSKYALKPRYVHFC